MSRLLMINGPNLGLLGQREPDIYGADTLADIESHLKSLAQQQGHELLCYQSDAEHELVRRIHAAPDLYPHEYIPAGCAVGGGHTVY